MKIFKLANIINNMINKKEKNYLLTYYGSILIVLIVNYFFVSKLNLESTLNLLVNFLIFTILLAIFSNLFRKKK